MPPAARRQDRSLWAEIGVAAVFVLWVIWPLVQPGRYLTAYDTITYSGPNLVVTTDQYRSGHMPLWNDEVFGGVPHLANTQTAALYPVNLLLAPLPAGEAVDLTVALHLVLLAVGTFWLLHRRLHLVAPARLIGTVAVIGSGTVMGRAQQFEQIAVIAWLPWLLVATDWLLTEERLRPRAVAAAAAAFAATAVSGHPQQIYITAAVVGLWVVGRTLDATRRAPTDGRGPADRLRAIGGRVGRLALAGVLAMALALPQLLASASLLGQTALEENQSLTLASTYGYVLKPSLLASTFFGNPFVDDQWLTSMGAEPMAFVGVAVVVLALLGLAVGTLERARRATVVLLGAGAVVATLLAMGPRCVEGADGLSCAASGAGFRLASAVVPGFSQTRAAGRWMLVAMITLAILAALGVDALARRAVTRRALVGAGAGLAILVLLALLAGPSAEGSVTTATDLWWAAMGALAIGAVVVAVLVPRRWAPTAAVSVLAVVVVVELAVPTRTSIVRRHMEDRAFDSYGTEISDLLAERDGTVVSVGETRFDDWAYLSHTLRPNTNATYGARSIDGYDGGLWVTRRWVDAVQLLANETAFDGSLPLSWQLAFPIDATRAARLGVGYLVIDVGMLRANSSEPDRPESEILAATAPGWTGPIARDGDLVLVENPVRSDDGALAFATVAAEDQAEAAALLGSASADEAVVEGGPTLTCDVDCAVVGVDVTSPDPGRIEAAVDLDRPALLSVTAQPLPGWRVTVDGAEAEVLAVDVLRTGVVLEPGRHEVAFTYHQPGLQIGLGVAGLALVLLLVLVWEPRRLRPAPPSS